MYSALLQKQAEVPAQPASIVNGPGGALRREDYPNVKFWDEEEYKKSRVNKDVAKVGDNDKNWKPQYDWLQDEYGNHPGALAEKKLNATCREVFEHIASDCKKNGVSPPDSFSHMDVLAKKFFHKEVRTAHPYVYFASDSWKGNKVGTLVFPGWKRTAQKNRRFLGEARRHGHAGSDGRYGGQGRRDEHRRHSKEGAHRFAVETSAGLEKSQDRHACKSPQCKGPRTP